jgi:glycosyltransferase involved in cell wall biosynthesis
MIKIVFVITSLSAGGAEKVFSLILKNIDKTKFNIILAIGKKEGPFLSNIPDKVKIKELAGSKKSSKSFFKLLKLLQIEKPDIVFSTLGMNTTSALCSLFLSKNIRFISRFGNTIGVDLEQRVKKDSYIKYLVQKYSNLLVLKTTEIVTQSQYMKNDLISYYKLNSNIKIHQIYNPVEFDKCVDNENNEKDFVQFLTIGRFDYQKGYEYLIEAFYGIVSVYPTARLIFIGKGILEEDMKKLAQNFNISKNIEFAGYQENPFSYSDDTNIFVSSSRFEGFSNVILESLSNAIPVIATDCPSGNREIIEDNINGWLSSMDGDIVKNLRNTMLLSIKRYKELDMKNEQIKLKNNFGIETIVNQYENLFLINN